MIDKLTLQEEQAMKAIWQTGEGNVKMFLDKNAVMLKGE